MKFFSTTILLLSAHCAAYGLAGSRLHSVRGRLSHPTKLFSASAAANLSSVSVGNTVGLGLDGVDNVVLSSKSAVIAAEENFNVNYGPGE